MKNSISLLLLLYALSLLFSCERNVSEQGIEYETIYSENDENQSEEAKFVQQTSNDPTITHQVLKNNNNNSLQYFFKKSPEFGMIRSRIPFPSSWKQDDEVKFTFTGPDGIKIFPEKGMLYSYSNDPQTNMINQQSGVPVSPPIPLAQLIEGQFVEHANQNNIKMVTYYSLPQLAEWNKRFQKTRFKSMPSQDTYEAAAIEWTDSKGISAMTVLHYFVSYDNLGVYWGYYFTIFESSSKVFEQAKKQYITGLLNEQINPIWLNAINQKEYNIAVQSWAGHNERMRLIQQRGQDLTANHNARMAAMDKNMENWRDGQERSDRIHNKEIDVIRGETTVSNPTTGTNYKVDAGANQYWINNQGEYIMSDNSLYNPNLDSNTNNQSWIEYHEQR